MGRGRKSPLLKTGCIEFAWLESSDDATAVVMLSPAVAMAAEVLCQRQLNITTGVASSEDSN